MSDFLRLVRKETRELLRPRYILPILLIPVMFIAMAQGFGGIEDEIEEEPTVGIVANDSGQYTDTVLQAYNTSANVTYLESGVDTTTAVRATREGGGGTLIVIPDGFEEQVADSDRQARLQTVSIVDNVGLSGIAASGKGKAPLQAAGSTITLNLTGATPAQLDPIRIGETTFVKGAQMDAPASALSGAISTQFFLIPLVIVMVIIFSGQMVMNSMGTENENKTLETLLTMPVKRRTIVAAKLVSSAVVGLFAAGLFSVSLFYYQSSLDFGNDGGGLPAAFSLGVADFALIGVAIFLAVVAALAMALCLGIFAGDQQGAQVLVFPLAVLAGAPAAVTVFVDVTTLSLPLQAVIYAIPFSYPALAPKQLMFGDPTLIVAGVVYEAIFAAAMVGLAVVLFDSDRVITGDAGRLSDVFSSLQR